MLRCDGGVESGLLSATRPAGYRPRAQRGSRGEHGAGYLDDVASGLRVTEGPPGAALGYGPVVFEDPGRKADTPDCGAVGIHYRPKRYRGCTRADGSETNPDLVERRFDPDGPDRLWVMDVTEHATDDGKVYLAAVIDAWSRRVVGWSIADHIRAELVADALQMATWRRRPPQGQTIAHSDHGSVYTSWLFGNRLRTAGLLGSMGSIGDCFDCEENGGVVRLVSDPCLRLACVPWR